MTTLNYWPNYWPYVRRKNLRRDLHLVAGPLVEPVSLELARQHLRIQAEGSPATHEDDSLISEVFLPAARESCEQYLGAALAPQTLELVMESFPYYHHRDIELPFGPVHAIDSINYLVDEVATAFVDYNFALYGDRVRLVHNASWPSADDSPQAVTIRYQTGYSLPGASPDYAPLPATLRAAVLLTLSQIYDHCMEGTICDISDIPVGCKYLLDPWKRRLGFV